MRILMSTAFFFEPPQAKIGTVGLAEQLSQRGHNVLVVSSAVEGASRVEVMPRGTKIVRQKVLYLKKIPLTIPIGTSFLQRTISRFSPDVIHAHESIFPTSATAAICARLYDVPFVLTLHGTISYSENSLLSFLSNSAESTFSTLTAKTADRVIILNEPLRARAKRLRVNDSKIIAIPNGVETSSSNDANAIRKTMKIEQGSFVVGFIGRLYPVKGLIFLSEAIKEVLKVDNSVVFVFIGGGPLSGLLENLAQQFPKNCVFLGYVKEARRIIPCFDVLVLPSLSEGLPTVLIEALASGVPSIATDIPENAAVIDNDKTGVLVKPANTQALTKAILSLRSKDLSTMKSNCIEVAKERYGWDTIIGRIERVYHDAIFDHNRN
jgi:teichuronic acid biosynthesis glycosyltransferase TuaC